MKQVTNVLFPGGEVRSRLLYQPSSLVQITRAVSRRVLHLLIIIAPVRCNRCNSCYSTVTAQALAEGICSGQVCAGICPQAGKRTPLTLLD